MPIYVVSHLRLSRPHDAGHRVIYVGPMSGSQSPDDYATTDQYLSPHLSERNQTHCELTALHQIARIHAHETSNTVGLVHYRRRFVAGPDWLKRIIRSTQKSIWTRKFSNFLLHHVELTESLSDQLLAQYDVIVPARARLKQTIRESYMASHVPQDWDILKTIIARDFPEYAKAFSFFESERTIHLYNMFVARTPFLKNYSAWLFAVIAKLETEIHPDGRDAFQMRVFGFLSERLLNVYLLKHAELKVMTLPVVQLYNESVVWKQSSKSHHADQPVKR